MYSSYCSATTCFGIVAIFREQLWTAVFFFLWRCDPTRVMASSFLRFLDHTQRRTTVGRTPLDEWSARRRDALLYVVMIFWCKLPEDGNNAETCRSCLIERIHRLYNCAVVGVTRVLIYHNALNEQCKCSYRSVKKYWINGQKLIYTRK